MALNQLGLGFLFTATDLASGTMAKVRNGFAQTRDEAGRFGTRSKEAFKQFGTGIGIMTAGLAGLGVLGAATHAAATFGTELGQIRTIVDEATLSTDQATDTIMGLTNSFSIGPLEQAKGLYETLSAGITNVAEATDLLSVANQFAVGGNTDLKGSVDVLTSSLNTYKDTGETAASLSDKLFTAIAAGKTTAGELSQSLGEVAPTAHALGVGFDELSASIAALTVQGIKTPQAITGLNAMLSNIAKPSSDAAAEAKRLGIAFDATTLKTKGLTGLMDQLAGNTKVNDETFTKLFGSIDGVKTAITLASNGGAKMHEVLEQMKNAGGATAKAFDVMSQTTAFQGKRFMGLFESSKILIGQALEPMAAKVMSLGASFLEAFNKIPKPIRDTIVKVAAAAAAITALVGAVVAAKAAFTIGAAFAAKFGIAAGGGIVATIGPAIAIIGALAGAFYALKFAFDNNIGGLATKFDGIIEPIKTAWEALSQLFSTGELDENLTQELLNGDNAAVNFAVKVKQVADNIMNFFDGVASGFETGLKAAEPVFKAFGDALDELGTAFGGLVGPVEEVDSGFAEAGATGQSVGGVLAKVATVIVDALTIAVKIVTGFVQVWGLVSDAFSEAGDAFSDVGAALSEVVSALSGGADGAAQSTGVWTTLGSILGGTVSVAIRLVGSTLSFVAGMLSNVATVAKGVVDVIAGIFTGDWGRIWKGVREIVAGAVAGVIDSVLGMVQFMADAGDAIGKAFGKDLGAGAALKQFRSDAKEFVKGSMGLPHTERVEATPLAAQTAFTSVPGAGLAGPAPAVAAVPPAGAAPTPADWSVASTAAARAAVAALPPTQVQATMVVDGEVLGRLAMKANASEASRAAATTGVDVG